MPDSHWRAPAVVVGLIASRLTSSPQRMPNLHILVAGDLPRSGCRFRESAGRALMAVRRLGSDAREQRFAAGCSWSRLEGFRHDFRDGHEACLIALGSRPLDGRVFLSGVDHSRQPHRTRSQSTPRRRRELLLPILYTRPSSELQAVRRLGRSPRNNVDRTR